MLLASVSPAALPVRSRVPFRTAVNVSDCALVALKVKSASAACQAKSGEVGVGSLSVMVPVRSSVPPRKFSKWQAGRAKVNTALSGAPSPSVSVMDDRLAQFCRKGEARLAELEETPAAENDAAAGSSAPCTVNDSVACSISSCDAAPASAEAAALSAGDPGEVLSELQAASTSAVERPSPDSRWVPRRVQRMIGSPEWSGVPASGDCALGRRRP